MSRGAESLSVTFALQPGQLVFDYYNAAQLADVAQSLGIDIAVSRSVGREDSGKAGGKATIKIFEISGEASSSKSESETISGTLPTALFLQLLGCLKRTESIQDVDLSSILDAKDALLATAADSNRWILLAGTFDVDPQAFTLRANGIPKYGSPSVVVHLPEEASELTSTGKIRLRRTGQIKADVLAQVASWSSDRTELAVIAHAILARVGGDPQFSWNLRVTHFNPSSSGAGSDWD